MQFGILMGVGLTCGVEVGGGGGGGGGRKLSIRCNN